MITLKFPRETATRLQRQLMIDRAGVHFRLLEYLPAEVQEKLEDDVLFLNDVLREISEKLKEDKP